MNHCLCAFSLQNCRFIHLRKQKADFHVDQWFFNQGGGAGRGGEHELRGKKYKFPNYIWNSLNKCC